MNEFRPFVATLSMLVLLGSAAGRADAPPAAATSADPVADAAVSLPSLNYFSSIGPDEIYEALRQSALFSGLDKEKPGSPFSVRVTHVYRRTSAGMASGIMSALLVGGTLGLLPAVTNRDLSITYELVVNGSVVTRYTYAKNLTRMFNVHSTDKTHGLGADGLAWVTETARQFAAAALHDPKVVALEAEYRYYYGPPTPASTPH